MRRMLIAATALLLLSGCVVTPLPEGLSEAERQQFAAEIQERQWEFSGIPDRARPVVDVTEVEVGDLERRIYECLVSSGIDEGYSLDNGVLVGSVAPQSSDERVAFYICSVSFMPPANYWGYLSRDQLNATYDYYQDWLIPCLEAHDYQVPLAPLREEVASVPGYLGWDPYTQLGARITDDAIADLEEECPGVPPWLYE